MTRWQELENNDRHATQPAGGLWVAGAESFCVYLSSQLIICVASELCLEKTAATENAHKDTSC